MLSVDKGKKIPTEYQKLHDIVFPDRQLHLVQQCQAVFVVTFLTTANRAHSYQGKLKRWRQWKYKEKLTVNAC